MENEILRAAAETMGLQIPPANGPASHGPQAASGGGRPRARRAALHGLCPPGPHRPAGAARLGHLDQRHRPGGVDPPGPGRLAVRWRGLPQGPGPAAPPAPGPGERQTGPAAAAPGGPVGAPADPGPPQTPPHDGTIIPQAPNQRWGTDATMAWTRVDGWVWVFACIDHDTAEPGRTWPRWRPLRRPAAGLRRVTDRWGRLGPDVARGLELRHDWGPQYRSAHFTGSLAWLGITDSPAFLGSRRQAAAPSRPSGRRAGAGGSWRSPPTRSAGRVRSSCWTAKGCRSWSIRRAQGG
jgi:hypothetical protein